MDFYSAAVVVLIVLAISDLIVGVSNDAVNFINSSLGSRVAPRAVIMTIASLGILAGVTFSSGMMEVARKGIFHPQLFTMPELMALFLAVMLTDIVLLDLYNTFGLPTSTTVSIVFELLGAAVAVSLIKINQLGQSVGALVDYINTGKALAIVFGILLSVIVAFCSGAVVQMITRLLFTFDFRARMKRYGALWGGVALASITFFILIKGAKGASFITPETLAWIQTHTWTLLLIAFGASAAVLQMLLWFTRVNILKPIVLAGTFALAMAFAANDLVNFIGVPLAGMSAYEVASASGDLATCSMEALKKPVRSDTLYLLLAGAVMVVTLWLSRKARTVSKTELHLGRQDEGLERFESTVLSQKVVRVVASFLTMVKTVMPIRVRALVARRLARREERVLPEGDGPAPFDLLRASVNLMVASALISMATSLKLPLSTTYVTFMVSMGSSLSDQAWGRESAVYRVTGVLTVIGGWFFTAFMAFFVSSVVAVAIYFLQVPAVVGLLGVVILLVIRNRRVHHHRAKEDEALEVFNLRKIQDAPAAIRVSFEHAGLFLEEVQRTLTAGFDGLFAEDLAGLRRVRRSKKRVQRWANILVANMFKVLRLLQREQVHETRRYTEIIATLQEIAESQRDIVIRAYLHVANNHAGLLDIQKQELERVKITVASLLDQTAVALRSKQKPNLAALETGHADLRHLIDTFDRNQIQRIQSNTSKTRLSILFYGFMWDALKIAGDTCRLAEIFRDLSASNEMRDRPDPDGPG